MTPAAPPPPSRLLGGLSPAEFLRTHWQRRPLRVADAWPLDGPPISPEELAGLACEPDAHARLVQEHHPAGPWHVSYGPFDADDFARLPGTHWTLLVSECERLHPPLRVLLEPFRFLPDWRIDDLMISYAVDGGSVGPHVDEYDVFLLQLDGVREWHIGDAPLPVEEEQFIDGLELRILRAFTPDRVWRQAPGDLLYLPPRVPHHGIARGPCLTASIGFRAPGARDLLGGWLEACIERTPEAARYRDPGRLPARHPAELASADIDALRELLLDHLDPRGPTFDDWLGRYLTEPRDPHDLAEPAAPPTPQALQAALRDGAVLEVTPAARLLWHDGPDGLRLYAAGESHPLPAGLRPLVERLTARRRLTAADLPAEPAAALDLLHALLAAGVLEIADHA